MRLLSQYNMVFANKTAHMNNMLLYISCYVPLLSLPVDVTPIGVFHGMAPMARAIAQTVEKS